MKFLKFALLFSVYFNFFGLVKGQNYKDTPLKIPSEFVLCKESSDAKFVGQTFPRPQEVRPEEKKYLNHLVFEEDTIDLEFVKLTVAEFYRDYKEKINYKGIFMDSNNYHSINSGLKDFPKYFNVNFNRFYFCENGDFKLCIVNYYYPDCCGTFCRIGYTSLFLINRKTQSINYLEHTGFMTGTDYYLNKNGSILGISNSILDYNIITGNRIDIFTSDTVFSEQSIFYCFSDQNKMKTAYLPFKKTEIGIKIKGQENGQYNWKTYESNYTENFLELYFLDKSK